MRSGSCLRAGRTRRLADMAKENRPSAKGGGPRLFGKDEQA